MEHRRQTSEFTIWVHGGRRLTGSTPTSRRGGAAWRRSSCSPTCPWACGWCGCRESRTSAGGPRDPPGQSTRQLCYRPANIWVGRHIQSVAMQLKKSPLTQIRACISLHRWPRILSFSYALWLWMSLYKTSWILSCNVILDTWRNNEVEKTMSHLLKLLGIGEGIDIRLRCTIITWIAERVVSVGKLLGSIKSAAVELKISENYTL